MTLSKDHYQLPRSLILKLLHHLGTRTTIFQSSYISSLYRDLLFHIEQQEHPKKD